MSIKASITINFSGIMTGHVSPVKIIKMFLKDGWTFSDYGGYSYLPIGENEGFNWVMQEKIAYNTLIKILEEKEQKNELIGIIMTWQNTNIGGSFLFRSFNTLSINLLINRKVFCDLKAFEITDVNWYLSKLLPTFKKNDLFVDCFSFEELS